MDPITIFELTGTVIGLSKKIYDFFKEVHNAPRDIREYLEMLDQTSAVFKDTQDYLQQHTSSSFYTRDRMELRIVQGTLDDCNLEFTLQWSFIESLNPSTRLSFFKDAVRRTKFVLSAEKIEAFTQKLQKVQALLSQTIATTTGKNTVLIREKLENVSLEVHEVNERSKAESLLHKQLLQQVQQFAAVMQDSTKVFLQLAKDTQIRSDARLDDLSQSFATVDSSLATATHMRPDELGVVQGSDTAEHLPPTGPTFSNAVLKRLEQSRDEFDKFGKSTGNAHGANDINVASIVDGTATWDAALKRTQSILLSKQGTQPTGLLDKLKQFSTIVNFVPTPFSSVISGSLELIVSAATQSKQEDTLVQDMIEMSDAIEMCHREQNLYQDPKLNRLIEQLYIEVLDLTKVLLDNRFRKSRLTLIKNKLDWPKNEWLETAMTRIRRTSESVLREVDYQHRLEMRRTSHRVVEIQVEQQRMARMLEHQKSILQEMEEERKVMRVIHGQQEILQVVQQIQRQLQAEADENGRG